MENEEKNKNKKISTLILPTEKKLIPKKEKDWMVSSTRRPRRRCEENLLMVIFECFIDGGRTGGSDRDSSRVNMDTIAIEDATGASLFLPEAIAQK